MEISVQKMIEDNIHPDFDPFFNILETFPESALIIDLDTMSVIYANQNFFNLSGFRQDEVISKSFLNFIIVPNLSDFLKEINEIELQKEGLNFDLVLKGQRNTILPIQLFCQKIPETKQNYAFFYIKNSTELRRLEVERNMLSHALRQVNEGLGLFDLEGTIIFVNESFLDTFGYERGEVIGKNIGSFFSPFIGYEFQLNILPASLKGGWNGELKAIRKDGKEITVFMSTSTVKDDDGQPVVVVAVLNDITLHKQLEAQLRQSQKMEAIGQLAGGVAHDFNNLLTVIEGYIDLLKSKLNGNTSVDSYIKQMKKATERAVSLTRQLLTFSRRQVVQPKIIDVNKTIKELSKMLNRLIGEHIELITNLNHNVWKIKIDPNQFEQVLLNLIVNARDAMPKGGELIIETEQIKLDKNYQRFHPDVKPGDYVLIKVTDTGVGMSEEVQQRIFEPFFTTKGKGKGTGLGLATVYGIIKQNNGHIAVQSELEKGTTFSVYLPAIKAKSYQEENHVANTHLRGSGQQILVVEDEYLVRELICDTLRNLGYKVLEAANGEQALKVFEQHADEIDLVLTDLIMPGINGKKLADRLQREKPDVRLLFMTGYDDNAISKQGMVAEDIDYISKPFSPAKLAKKLDDVFAS
ncbi:MAG: PAS domain S-box protein [Caldisericaceae bacterium]|nr:PAS domain S-box protein [Caldisericaceae bacterium]